MRTNNLFVYWATAAMLFVLCAFGLWTVLAWLATVGGWSFSQVVAASPYLVPFLLLLIPLVFLAARRSLAESTPDIDTGTPRNPTPLPLAWPIVSAVLLLAALGLTARGYDGSFTLQWILFAAASVVLAWWVHRSPLPSSSPAGQPQPRLLRDECSICDLGIYLLFAALLVLAYALSTNSDADDTHFIAVAVSLLQQPEAEIFRFDSIFGEAGIQNQIYLQNLGQSWELLTGLLAAGTGMDLLPLYYWWQPLPFLLLLPIPLFLLARTYYPRAAWAGVLFAVLFLLAWSTFNHHGGQFFIPRFFQGKSTFVSLYVPAIFYATGVLIRTRSPSWLVIVALMLIGSAGATSSGLYIGPLVAGLATLTYSKWDPRSLAFSAALLLAVSLPNLVMLIDAYQAAVGTGAVAGGEAAEYAGKKPPLETKNDSMFGQFGGGKTLALILLLSWLAIAYARGLGDYARRNELLRLLVVLVLIAYSRPMAEALATLSGVGNAVWRWHWALPIGLVLALTGAGALNLWWQRKRFDGTPAIVSVAVAATPMAVLALLLAVNASFLLNRYSMEVRTIKVQPRQSAILAYLVEQDLQGRNVLADTRVAQLLPRIQHGAKLVSAGPLYWHKPYFPTQETWDRYRLSTLIEQAEPLSDEDRAFASEQIPARAIDLVIFDPQQESAQSKQELLESLGLSCEEQASWTVCSGPRKTR